MEIRLAGGRQGRPDKGWVGGASWRWGGDGCRRGEKEGRRMDVGGEKGKRTRLDIEGEKG